MKKSCSVSGCHSGKYPKIKLNLEEDEMLDALVDVPSRQAAGRKLVDTENPETSYLLVKLKGGEGLVGAVMPINLPPLGAPEIETMERWVWSLKAPPAEKASDAPKEEKEKPEDERDESR
jgi:hypothetical protein